MTNLTWEVTQLVAQPLSGSNLLLLVHHSNFKHQADDSQMRTALSLLCLLAVVKVDSVVKVTKVMYNSQTIDKVKI